MTMARQRAAGSGADDGGDGETSRFHRDHLSPFISHPVSVSSFPALSRESMPERRMRQRQPSRACLISTPFHIPIRNGSIFICVWTR